MNHRLSWLAVVQWIALTVAGMLLAAGLHFPGDFGAQFWSQVEPNWSGGVLGFIFGAVSGLMIAGLQALVLRGHGQPARPWILFNMLGYGLIHAVADAIPYQPLTLIGGAVVLAVCQYLALRASLTRPVWWLPVAAGAWWLGFGLTEGVADYNLLVIGLLQGAASGLALRLLLIPASSPAPNRWWAALSQPQRVLVVAGLVLVIGLFLVTFASLSGLTGFS